MPITEEERAALARGALAEITDPADVGALLGMEQVEPGVIDVRFASAMTAYADWHWTVSTSDLPDGEVTVLEVELLPGDDSLLAPPWVPWAERLAEWRKQHPDELHPDEVDEDEDEDEDADEDDDSDVEAENDLGVDDDLDELDEAELEGEIASEEVEQESDDDDDLGDDEDSDDEDSDEDVERGPRPADEDRSL